MKILSNSLIISGLAIAVLGACCMDSPGAYGYIAGAACILGGLIAGTGYAIRTRRGRRDCSLEQFHQSDVHQDDDLMLCHALDDGIERMKELMRLNGVEMVTEEIQILGDGCQKVNRITLPTKDGPVQMVFRENRIVNGCVSTKE